VTLSYESVDVSADASRSPVIRRVTTETAWPDDATIVRANDLGVRNVELYRYYAESDARTVYRYDLNTDTIERLGNIQELAMRH